MRIGLRHRRRGMLDKILIPKRAEIARMLAGPPLAPERTPGGGVEQSLRRASGGALQLIAEVKFCSPSAGELSRVLGAADRAVCYARGGAAMVSVLCDQPFFGGSFDDLARCRDALDEAFGTARPRLLCKEFVLDEVQLRRAASCGADAALLIARIVDEPKLVALARAARDLGLTPLIEVATLEELEAARQAEASVIGVNARDLNTLRMDPQRAATVLAAIDPAAVRVHLSGLATAADVTRVAASCADAALIGEALMRQDDPAPLLAAMRAAATLPAGAG
jgi:indole-3-glycerol phosphate synthase